MQRQVPPRLYTDAPITSALSLRTNQATAEGTTTTLASQNAFLSNVEEEQNKKLDNEIEYIVTSFRDIVKSPGFHEMVRMPGRSEDRPVDKDKYRNALDGFLVELRAATLVRSCESLLTMTHDLKTTLLLNDTQTLMKLHEDRRKALNARTLKIKSKILQLNDAINDAIWEMESVLGGGQPNGTNGSLSNIKMEIK
ncbi:20618_t:CDS:2 [Funneliformis geosporum]|uniref:13469_t:CDS:1 n=1 Tax=Funneliformis geosporum TaxID=1117311 RepID=A0A9W4WY36_9GLOM|nr:20618_t:CDS:2 [Funneliformis geosporum]CAI2187774.1 13469_t:CDS:2 [Funneliformis geosporum]